MTTTLSLRQQTMMRFIGGYIRDHEYAPSVREIQDGCGLSSTANVDYGLKALERKGYIVRDPGMARSIRLLGRRRYVSVPIIGTLDGRQPIPAYKGSI